MLNAVNVGNEGQGHDRPAQSLEKSWNQIKTEKWRLDTADWILETGDWTSHRHVSPKTGRMEGSCQASRWLAEVW